MWDWDLLQSILLALLVALALVGLWHLAARACGYKVLPMYQRSACGSEVHQLAYITEHERHQLMAAGGSGKAQPGTQGVPCYPPVDSDSEDEGPVPPPRKRSRVIPDPVDYSTHYLQHPSNSTVDVAMPEADPNESFDTNAWTWYHRYAATPQTGYGKRPLGEYLEEVAFEEANSETPYARQKGHLRWLQRASQANNRRRAAEARRTRARLAKKHEKEARFFADPLDTEEPYG